MILFGVCRWLMRLYSVRSLVWLDVGASYSRIGKSRMLPGKSGWRKLNWWDLVFAWQIHKERSLALHVNDWKDCHAFIAQDAFVDGAFCWTPVKELTALLQIPQLDFFWGGGFMQRGVGCFLELKVDGRLWLDVQAACYTNFVVDNLCSVFVEHLTSSRIILCMLLGSWSCEHVTWTNMTSSQLQQFFLSQFFISYECGAFKFTFWPPHGTNKK